MRPVSLPIGCSLDCLVWAGTILLYYYYSSILSTLYYYYSSILSSLLSCPSLSLLLSIKGHAGEQSTRNTYDIQQYTRCNFILRIGYSVIPKCNLLNSPGTSTNTRKEELFIIICILCRLTNWRIIKKTIHSTSTPFTTLLRKTVTLVITLSFK